MEMSKEQFMFFTAGEIFGHFSANEQNNYLNYTTFEINDKWGIFHNSHLDYTIPFTIRDIIQQQMDEMYEMGDEPYECKCDIDIINNSIASITYRRINKNGQSFASWARNESAQSDI